jgi:hypothetical protein
MNAVHEPGSRMLVLWLYLARSYEYEILSNSRIDKDKKINVELKKVSFTDF